VSKKRHARSRKPEAKEHGPAEEHVPARGGTERWPGKCPKCGEAVECYCRTSSASRGVRVKYWRCVGRCGFRTTSEEQIRGPRPRPATPEEPRPEPEPEEKVPEDFTAAGVKSEDGA